MPLRLHHLRPLSTPCHCHDELAVTVTPATDSHHLNEELRQKPPGQYLSLPNSNRSTVRPIKVCPILHSSDHLPIYIGSVTGVTVLEHLERLDAVEASLKRLGGGEDIGIEEEDEDEEVDVGESLTKPLIIPGHGDTEATSEVTPPFTPQGSPPLTTVHEHLPMALENSVTEADLAMMSKSLSHMDRPVSSRSRWASFHRRQQEGSRALDWIHNGDAQSEPQPQIAIVEVRCVSFEILPSL